MSEYLHRRKDFHSLIRTLASQIEIEETLVEKDYWIMHVLHSLKTQGFVFELKGGTSLSKGFRIIDRFSEDIDLHISPPANFQAQTGIKLNENPKNIKPAVVENRRIFFDWLAENIEIDGIVQIVRDAEFDDKDYYRSGGIRLNYDSPFDALAGIKEGILLEAGFAQVTPNAPLDISSWMFDKATEVKLDVIDNRAMGIACYHPGYTLVEKLQTIVTKYRNETSTDADTPKVNFMRQYYDIFQLLKRKDIQDFIGTEEYHDHKEAWFRAADKEIPLSENPAIFLPDEKIREAFTKRYKDSKQLYYKGQPDFDSIIEFIQSFAVKL